MARRRDGTRDGERISLTRAAFASSTKTRVKGTPDRSPKLFMKLQPRFEKEKDCPPDQGRSFNFFRKNATEFFYVPPTALHVLATLIRTIRGQTKG